MIMIISNVLTLIWLDVTFKLVCNPDTANIVAVHMGFRNASEVMKYVSPIFSLAHYSLMTHI